MESTLTWATDEFGGAKLGDTRRTRRLVKLAAEVAARPAGTITRACASSAAREGAFRLLENVAVLPEALRLCMQNASISRCPAQAIIFVPVDATSLKVTDTKKSKGVGR